MLTALISDIHANATALETVLADIDQRGVDRIVCLGDIIGYGPHPTRCIDLVHQRCEFALMGNHDFAVLYEPTSFNTSAEAAAFWTRRQFEFEPDADLRRQRWEFLGSLEVRHRDSTALWVHASPCRPINEYIFPDDVVTAPAKMTNIFDRIESKCCVGHTHIPGVFTDEPDFYPPGDLGGRYAFRDDEKCIINPGSVGQPRDRDPRAAYALMDDTGVEFIRIDYDIDSVIHDVQRTEGLSDWLGQRLHEGR